jgi:hypothetical protein
MNMMMAAIQMKCSQDIIEQSERSGVPIEARRRQKTTY